MLHFAQHEGKRRVGTLGGGSRRGRRQPGGTAQQMMGIVLGKVLFFLFLSEPRARGRYVMNLKNLSCQWDSNPGLRAENLVSEPLRYEVGTAFE